MNAKNKIKAEAIVNFAERLKRYYFDTVKGTTHSCLVSYHIDQILKEELQRLENDEKDHDQSV